MKKRSYNAKKTYPQHTEKIQPIQKIRTPCAMCIARVRSRCSLSDSIRHLFAGAFSLGDCDDHVDGANAACRSLSGVFAQAAASAAPAFAHHATCTCVQKPPCTRFESRLCIIYTCEPCTGQNALALAHGSRDDSADIVRTARSLPSLTPCGRVVRPSAQACECSDSD